MPSLHQNLTLIIWSPARYKNISTHTHTHKQSGITPAQSLAHAVRLNKGSTDAMWSWNSSRSETDRKSITLYRRGSRIPTRRSTSNTWVIHMIENENSHLGMCAVFHLSRATLCLECVCVCGGVKEQGQENSNTTEASCAAPFAPSDFP